MTDSTSFNLKNLPTMLPINIDWAKQFNNNHPVDVEIGTGRPHFFFDRALNCPERNIVGIEWKYEFILSAKKRIVRESINNAVALHGNAWLLLPLLFTKASISQVMINFPDPWWKTRHKKRLILNEVFLSALHSRMKQDGFILLQTDVKELFDFYIELINNHGAFFYHKDILSAEIEGMVKAKTHREKKCLENNLPIYRAVFCKL